jgi:hypothetical protein
MTYIITLIMSVVKINKKTHWNMLLILTRYKYRTDAWEILKTQWSKEKGQKDKQHLQNNAQKIRDCTTRTNTCTSRPKKPIWKVGVSSNWIRSVRYVCA